MLARTRGAQSPELPLASPPGNRQVGSVQSGAIREPAREATGRIRIDEPFESITMIPNMVVLARNSVRDDEG